MKSGLASVRNLWTRSPFLRNVAVLAGGTAVGQALTTAVSPILTRLYGPEDFGALAVYTSILEILMVVGALRYELAIPLPKEDGTAANVLALSLAAVTFTSIGTAILAGLLGAKVATWTNAGALQPYLWLLSVSLAGAGAYQVLSYWSTRTKSFSVLSRTRVYQASGQAGVQVVGGLLQLGPLGLILGHIMGRILGISTLARNARIPLGSVRLASCVSAARTYKHFPLFTAWASVVNVLGTQAPPLLLSRLFGVEVTGLFSLTMRVLALPTWLIGQAVAQVFYREAAEHRGDSRTVGPMIERTAQALLMISLPIFGAVALVGTEMFGLVFGPSWSDAGRFAGYLAPWMALSLISSPLSGFPLICGKQKQASLLTLYETSLRLAALWVGGAWGSPVLAIGLYAGVGALISVVYIGWVLRLAGSGLSRWGRKVGPYLATASGLFLVLFAVRQVTSPLTAIMVTLISVALFSLTWGRRVVGETSHG